MIFLEEQVLLLLNERLYDRMQLHKGLFPVFPSNQEHGILIFRLLGYFNEQILCLKTYGSLRTIFNFNGWMQEYPVVGLREQLGITLKFLVEWS